jgi:hypothetical protein
MMVARQSPFALSLSKGCTFLEEGLGFDRLSPNGSGVGEA